MDGDQEQAISDAQENLNNAREEAARVSDSDNAIDEAVEAADDAVEDAETDLNTALDEAKQD